MSKTIWNFEPKIIYEKRIKCDLLKNDGLFKYSLCDHRKRALSSATKYIYINIGTIKLAQFMIYDFFFLAHIFFHDQKNKNYEMINATLQP